MATWPVSLQQKLDRDTFREKIGSTVIRSDVDTGPAKVRRRMTKSVDPITCSITLNSAAEYTTFMNFFDITLNGGVNTFTFNHPVTGVSGTYRFADTPDIKPLGGFVFSVAMQWERLP